MNKIQQLRKSLDMSQREFAEYFGFNVRTVQNWESDRANFPDYVVDMIERRISEGMIYTDLKETKSKTKTYEYRDGFLVDLVDNGKEIEAYLYHKDYSIKNLIFGLRKEDVNSEEELKEIITANLTNDTYIEKYTEQYMEDSDYGGETMMDIYHRTLNNCRFYEKENDKKSLLNEIGVLRGIYYCLQCVGVAPDDEELDRFIELQNQLKESLD